MKSHTWDELNDSAKDFFDSVGFIPENDFEEDANDKRQQRRRLTEMRRRTEERLDWKRMYGEMQFDDLDHYDDFDDLEDIPGRHVIEDAEFDDEF
jgi:hypothetical protein